MRKGWLAVLAMLMLPLNLSVGCGSDDAGGAPSGAEMRIALPGPARDSNASVEESLLKRRSVRDYTDQALTLPEVAQLLWAAQGITDPAGRRTAPSAGALYPLEVYAVIGNVAGVSPGVYRYAPDSHEMVKVLDGDQRKALSRAALAQESVNRGAMDIVITAVYERTTGKYGERGIRYVYMEAGHAAQNVCLQAVALGLGTVTIGAFSDDRVKKVLGLPEDEEPLYIMPVGRTSD